MTENTPETLPVVTAVCCREWPVFPLMPVGRCGLCDERPMIQR